MARREPDPRWALARLVARLELRSDFVTLDDIQRAAGRRPNASLPPGHIGELVARAVAEQLLLTDRRTFLEPAAMTFEDRAVFRVNRRHPLVRGQLL